MKIKPIPFNADMTKAIWEGRKTVTRRVIKPQPVYDGKMWRVGNNGCGWGNEVKKIRFDNKHTMSGFSSPYQPGEIVYVPEAWRRLEMWESFDFKKRKAKVEFRDGEVVQFCFDDWERGEKWGKYLDKPKDKWQSPYFMPREAARLFLRVTDVRVERLHDVTEERAIAEGARYTDFGVYTPSWKMSLDGGKTFHNAKPLHHPGYHFKDVTGPDQCFESARSAFANYWGRTIKPKDLDLYCWAANPWVWVIEFERISKEEVKV